MGVPVEIPGPFRVGATRLVRMWTPYDGPARTGLDGKGTLAGWLRYHAVDLLEES